MNVPVDPGWLVDWFQIIMTHFVLRPGRTVLLPSSIFRSTRIAATTRGLLWRVFTLEVEKSGKSLQSCGVLWSDGL